MWATLRPLVAVAILAGLAWRLGTGAFVDALRLVDGAALSAALGIGLLTTVCSVWRWRLVARGLGIPLPFGTALADYYRALFLDAVLPAGVLGDAHRAIRHGRRAGDVGRGIRAVVLERVAGQVVLVVVGVGVLLGEPSLSAALGLRLLPGLGVAAAVLGGLVVVGALAAWAWRGRGGRISLGPMATALTDARLGLLARNVWPGVLAFSLATLAGHLTLFLVAARTAGSAAPAGRLLPLMLLALLAMALPVNVGGWAPRRRSRRSRSRHGPWRAAGSRDRRGVRAARPRGEPAGRRGADPPLGHPPRAAGIGGQGGEAFGERLDQVAEHGLSLSGGRQ